MEIVQNSCLSDSYNIFYLDRISMKTLTPKQVSHAERKWYIIDAQGQTLGRLSTLIATTLR